MRASYSIEREVKNPQMGAVVVCLKIPYLEESKKKENISEDDQCPTGFKPGATIMVGVTQQISLNNVGHCPLEAHLKHKMF